MKNTFYAIKKNKLILQSSPKLSLQMGNQICKLLRGSTCTKCGIKKSYYTSLPGGITKSCRFHNYYGTKCVDCYSKFLGSCGNCYHRFN